MEKPTETLIMPTCIHSKQWSWSGDITHKTSRNPTHSASMYGTECLTKSVLKDVQSSCIIVTINIADNGTTSLQGKT